MRLYFISHKPCRPQPHRPQPHRPHEKTISATMNNHMGHRKNVLLFGISIQSYPVPSQSYISGE